MKKINYKSEKSILLDSTKFSTTLVGDENLLHLGERVFQNSLYERIYRVITDNNNIIIIYISEPNIYKNITIT